MSTSDNQTIKILQAARQLNISVQTIHSYERHGVIVLKRDAAGYRIFDETDMERLRCIRNMIKKEALNLSGIRSLMSMIPCWDMNKVCSEEKKYLNCPVYEEGDGPCWIISKQAQNCHSCVVYKNSVDCRQVKKYISHRMTSESESVLKK